MGVRVAETLDGKPILKLNKPRDSDGPHTHTHKTLNHYIFLSDEFGRRVRGKYDGPKINDYDKFCKYFVNFF